MDYTFSGHDTFHCRQFWLKKGFDLISQGKSFSEEAVVDLGVGKNMVNAVRHWMRAFDLIDDKKVQLKHLAEQIFSNEGWDPYLEDEGTLWLLHYLIAKNEYKASAFYLIFNHLREEKPEFNEEQFLKFVNQFGEFNPNTIKKDFSVFIRTYLGKKNEHDIEDSFSGVLSELGLIEEQERNYFDEHNKARKKVNYLIQRKARSRIPSDIILYGIAENPNYGKSISFEDLYQGKNSIGTIFALNRDGLLEHLENIEQKHKDVVLSNEAGIRELQFSKGKPEPFDILKQYYGND